MVADVDIIRERLDKIRQHRLLLEKFSAWDVPKLARDYEEQMKILHLLQIAIEACMDIAAHIISAEQLGVPVDHADLFRILGSHKIIEENFVSALQDMARFRNRLVHFYMGVDLERVVFVLHNNLRDFDLFAEAIEKYLGRAR